MLGVTLLYFFLIYLPSMALFWAQNLTVSMVVLTAVMGALTLWQIAIDIFTEPISQ